MSKFIQVGIIDMTLHHKKFQYQCQIGSRNAIRFSFNNFFLWTRSLAVSWYWNKNFRLNLIQFEYNESLPTFFLLVYVIISELNYNHGRRISNSILTFCIWLNTLTHCTRTYVTFSATNYCRKFCNITIFTYTTMCPVFLFI